MGFRFLHGSCKHFHFIRVARPTHHAISFQEVYVPVCKKFNPRIVVLLRLFRRFFGRARICWNANDTVCKNGGARIGLQSCCPDSILVGTAPEPPTCSACCKQAMQTDRQLVRTAGCDLLTPSHSLAHKQDPFAPPPTGSTSTKPGESNV